MMRIIIPADAKRQEFTVSIISSMPAFLRVLEDAFAQPKWSHYDADLLLDWRVDDALMRFSGACGAANVLQSPGGHALRQPRPIQKSGVAERCWVANGAVELSL